MKSNVNSKLIGGLLVAVLATAISLGTPHAFAGPEEDKASSDAAAEADKAAEKADSAWDDYEKQKADAKDKGDSDKDAEKAAADAKKAAEEAEADAKKTEKASKAADEKASQADDKEIENRADKKEKADVRKKRHENRAKDRAKRAQLRKLKAELAKRKRIGGSQDSSKTKELEKLIEDLEKSLGGTEPSPKQPVPLPGAENFPLSQVIATGKIKVETSGTGETIGHVADMKIQNLTDQSLMCTIPPIILESRSGKNQHYACPSGQTVALNPHQTKTVPMNGVCLNRNKPPVAKGVSGDLVVNEANPTGPQNPNSHIPPSDAGKLLRSCAAKYAAAEQLQKSGALKNLPYHDPQKQKDIIVQWSTWTDPQVCNIVGAPPATKEDLKKVVYKQVEEQGPMTPATKKKVEQGIDTIFEKVELTTAKAKDLEEPEKEIPPVAVTTVAGTPSSGQPVSAPTAAPGESVAATPTAVPQGPGGTTTEPTATPTPCKEDLLALPMAKDLVSAAVKACKDLDRLDREAGEAKDAADADDATPTGKEAKAKADKAAADAKAAKEIADEADAGAKAAAKAKAKDAKAKARDAEDKRKKAEAADKAAEAAKSPLRKKDDEARKKVIEGVGAKWDAQREAKDAIKKLKCPENIDKLTKQLEEACGK